MNSNDEQTVPNPRRTFFTRIAAAAISTVALGGLAPKILQTAVHHAEGKVSVKPHPLAVSRDEA
jgi:hypothetical protein